MFKMRTDSRNTSVTSSLATRPHHSNLYGRKFNAWLYCAHKGRGLRPWIAPVGLGSTGNVRVTLGVPSKFLGWLRAAPGQSYLANVARGPEHTHNGPGSP